MPARSRLSITALALVASATAPAVVWTLPQAFTSRLPLRATATAAPTPMRKIDPEMMRQLRERTTRPAPEIAANAEKAGFKVPVDAGVPSTQKPNVSIPTEQKTEAPKPKSSEGWLKKMVADRVDITGNRILGFHQHSVDGDRTAFDNLTYFGRGNRQFTDDGQMTVQGRKVLGFLDFDMAVTDNRIQDPYNQRTTLSYARGPLSLSYGDVRANLTNTNQFTPFSRTLNGTVLGWRSGRMELKAVHSVSRGSARTVSIEGSNSAGPYYLQSGRVLADSLEIQVDGQAMRLGQDYILDSDVGAITFINRTISPTSVIVATYEGQSFSDANGNLRGAGMTYDFGRVGRVGFTMVEQTGMGDASSRTVEQYFVSSNIPGTWYMLDTFPREGTMQIRIPVSASSSRWLAPGEYEVDTALPRFRILTDTFAEQTILVNYRPKVVQSVVGDRRTMGVDWRLPIGKKGKSGYLQFDYADGRSLGNDGIGGVAKGATFNYKHGDLSLRTGLRDVPSTFVTVESRGFNRNERAWNVDMDYARGRYTYGLNHNNSSIGVLNGEGITQSSRVATTSGFLNYSDPSGTQWGLNQSRSVSRRIYETQLDTTSLTGTKLFLKDRLSLNMGLDYQTGRGPMSNGAAIEMGNLQMSTARTGFDWRLGGGLGMNGRVGISRISTLKGDGTGRDAQIGLNYRPNERWTVSAVRIDSDSGQTATLSGFSSGYGVGYGGNGFSGGAFGDVLASGASSLQSNQLSADFRASDRLSLTGRAYSSRSAGDLSSNADTQGYGLAVNYDLGRFTNLAFSLDRSSTRFLGDASQGTGLSFTGRTESTSYSLSFVGAPKGRMTYSIGATGYTSGGASGFSGQQSTLWDANLGYRLNGRQRVSFAYTQGLSRGYYGQNESLASAAYEYRLWGNIALRGIYRWRNVANLNATSALGAYRSRGLDLELSFDFGR
ncbi:hypothetical protein EON79_13015 [bacterium]|nr:MAG: hypothetical protein EON79_13015 [bacterium]